MLLMDALLILMVDQCRFGVDFISSIFILIMFLCIAAWRTPHPHCASQGWKQEVQGSSLGPGQLLLGL